MSLLSTALCGLRVKRPVAVPFSALLVCDAWPPVSDDPAVSMMLMRGSAAMSSALIFAVMMAPPVMTLRNVGHCALGADQLAAGRGVPLRAPLRARESEDEGAGGAGGVCDDGAGRGQGWAPRPDALVRPAFADTG